MSPTEWFPQGRGTRKRLRRETEGVGLASLCSACLRFAARTSGSNCALIPPKGFKPAAPGNGGGGIRTHGDLRLFGFQDRCIKPLCHPSSSEQGENYPQTEGLSISRGGAPATFRVTFAPQKKTAARNPDGGCEFMIEETYSSFCCTSSPTAFTPSPTCSTALPAALSVSLVAS